MSATAPSTTNCASCNDSLLVPAPVYSDSDSDSEAAPTSSNSPATATDLVPDDVELTCGHHYHWDCFAEHYGKADDDIKHACPTCGTSVVEEDTAKLLVTLRNECGIQQAFDIGALLEEEAFYDEHPELKIIRAFLEFCAEGDTQAVIDLLAEAPELVNAQDFENGQTGLHVAVQNRREEMLVLLLARGANRLAQDFEGKDFFRYAHDMGATEEEMRRLEAL